VSPGPFGKILYSKNEPVRDGTGAEEHLAMVLRYVGAVAVEQACVRVPVPRDAVGSDGIVADPAIRAAFGAALAALAERARG